MTASSQPCKEPRTALRNALLIFSFYRSRGQMIKIADVERRPDEDDDWIMLEFSDDDPAVSNFRVS